MTRYTATFYTTGGEVRMSWIGHRLTTALTS